MGKPRPMVPQQVCGKARVKNPSSLCPKASPGPGQQPAPQACLRPASDVLSGKVAPNSVFSSCSRSPTWPDPASPPPSLQGREGLCLKQTLGGTDGLWPFKLACFQQGAGDCHGRRPGQSPTTHGPVTPCSTEAPPIGGGPSFLLK